MFVSLQCTVLYLWHLRVGRDFHTRTRFGDWNCSHPVYFVCHLTFNIGSPDIFKYPHVTENNSLVTFSVAFNN